MSVVSCSEKVPNAQVCLTTKKLTGNCKGTIDHNKDVLVPTNVWWTPETQIGRISMTIDDFAQYQSFVERVCLKIKCTTEELNLIKKGKKVLNELFIEAVQKEK